MRRRTIARAAAAGLACIAILATCAAGFEVWLTPRDMAPWIAGWIAGLCT